MFFVATHTSLIRDIHARWNRLFPRLFQSWVNDTEQSKRRNVGERELDKEPSGDPRVQRLWPAAPCDFKRGYVDPAKNWLLWRRVVSLPSRELTYPPLKVAGKMIFLSQR